MRLWLFKDYGARLSVIIEAPTVRCWCSLLYLCGGTWRSVLLRPSPSPPWSVEAPHPASLSGFLLLCAWCLSVSPLGSQTVSTSGRVTQQTSHTLHFFLLGLFNAVSRHYVHTLTCRYMYIYTHCVHPCM